MIEYRVGSETHSSAWGNFYVKGLEKWEAKEGGKRDRHHSYTELVCLDVPNSTIFTVFDQSGDKHGTNEFNFFICEAFICEAQDTVPQQCIRGGCYRSGGYIEGNFAVIALGEGKARAPRLMDWWGDMPKKCAAFLVEKDGEKSFQEGTRRRYALWCAEHISTRGLKDIPPLPPAEEQFKL
jgi:hypothetical protein